MINTFLPMRNKFDKLIFVYDLGIKLLESIFCLLLFVEAFSLQNVVEMLEEVAGDWREFR